MSPPRFGYLLIVLVCLVALAGQAMAGAWPRERGSVFVSTGVQLGYSGTGIDHQRATVYGEYGLGGGWTLGVDLAHHDDDGDAIITLRRQIAGQGAWVLSGGLGLGARRDWRSTKRLLRPELSWGRGFDSRWGSGWMSLDGALEYKSGASQPALKLDATIGLNRGDSLMLILQAQTARYPGADTQIRLQPSVIWKLSARHSLEISPIIGVTGSHDRSLKLGLWTEF